MEIDQVKRFGYSPEEYKKFKIYAWRFLLGFSFLYMCIYCCRLNLAAVMPLMMEEQGWTTVEMGVITGTLFWTYGFGHLINGRLGEIFGSNRFVILSVLLSVGANIFISFQSSVIIIAIIWIQWLLQSMAWSPGMSALIKWWPGDRGFAQDWPCLLGSRPSSMYTGRYSCSCIIAGYGLERVLFSGHDTSGHVNYLLVRRRLSPVNIGLKVYEEENPVKRAHEEELRRVLAEKGKLYPYVHLLSNWRFDLWLIIAFVTGLARYGLVTWIPLYFIQTFDVNIKTGLVSSLVLPLGMAIGTLVVPWATDRFCPTNRLPAVISSGLVAAFSVGVFLIQPGFLAQALLFISGFCVYAINGLCWAYACDIGEHLRVRLQNS